MADVKDWGLEALEKLKSTEPPVFLTPSSISSVARVASQYLFTKLKPHNPKSLSDELLVDGFDAEQIWQQIDLQCQPLLSSLRHQVKRFAKNPEEVRKLGNLALGDSRKDEMDMDELDSADDDDDVEDDDDDDDDDEIEANVSEGEEEEEDGEKEEEENEGIEDKFFKIRDLEDFLEEGEAQEYGIDFKNKKAMSMVKKQNLSNDDDDDDEEDEEDNEDDEDDEFGAFGGEDIEESYKLGKARFEDFFGGEKKETKMIMKDVIEDEEAVNGNQGNEKLYTHEKELLKLQSKIEEMEKANLDPKHWTMQGEVTATKRPKNSALEVDLDFEHNARPPPVITEEVTASLEDIIKSRIIEARFDDVQRAPSLPTKAKKRSQGIGENMHDDSKSKKGLAEVYEEEYVQKSNPSFAPAIFSDELKKEVIEEMSIQTNVPAIAMEEVAPVAVSDAAMLAPEEIFSGTCKVKEESELTQEERKRRRAKKKRKFKGK